MAKVRSLSYIVQKYTRVTPGKAREYEEGVKNPKKVWEEETKAAAPAWEQGVQDAIERGAFPAGVELAGQSTYVNMALKKGVRRYPDGVRLGVDKYQKNFAPYREVIEATELPPRKAKGDPANIERVAAIAAALHEEKVRRKSLRGT